MAALEANEAYALAGLLHFEPQPLDVRPLFAAQREPFAAVGLVVAAPRAYHARQCRLIVGASMVFALRAAPAAEAVLVRRFHALLARPAVPICGPVFRRTRAAPVAVPILGRHPFVALAALPVLLAGRQPHQVRQHVGEKPSGRAQLPSAILVRAVIGVVDLVVEHCHLRHEQLHIVLHEIGQHQEYRQNGAAAAAAIFSPILFVQGVEGGGQQLGAAAKRWVGENAAFVGVGAPQEFLELGLACGAAEEVVIEHVVMVKVGRLGAIVKRVESVVKVQQHTLNGECVPLAPQVFVQPRCADAYDFAANVSTENETCL